MENNSNTASIKEETKIVNKEIEPKLPAEPTSRKNMKEERARKKDDKSVEQVLKALNSLETTEEKLAAMCKKYADIVDENRKLQLSLKQADKRMMVLQREKEQLQTEHSKAVLTRSRLESLCRELQRQNKAVKDESLLKIREEEEKRKEVSTKFQSTLADVTSLMQQNNEKNCKLREDNLEMTKKFKSVCEQYELREQQVEKISKQLQLEAQLADAKMAAAKMEMAAEKEVLLREKQQLLLEVTQCQAKIQELQTTETNLRSQISLYTNKYDEFQSALHRSNDVFEGFKGEMEKMSKKICKLEKETSSWKQRWEKSHQALLEMAADKQQRDSELALTSRQLNQLQKLCRTLQAERTALLAQVKGAGKTAAAPIAVDGESAQDSTSEDKESKESEKGTELDSSEKGQGDLGAISTERANTELPPLSTEPICEADAADTSSQATSSPEVASPQSSPEKVAADLSNPTKSDIAQPQQINEELSTIENHEVKSLPVVNVASNQSSTIPGSSPQVAAEIPSSETFPNNVVTESIKEVARPLPGPEPSSPPPNVEVVPDQTELTGTVPPVAVESLTSSANEHAVPSNLPSTPISQEQPPVNPEAIPNDAVPASPVAPEGCNSSVIEQVRPSDAEPKCPTPQGQAPVNGPSSPTKKQEASSSAVPKSPASENRKAKDAVKKRKK